METNKTDNEWLTIEEVCERISKSERTVRRLLSEGEFESRIEGRRRLVSAKSVADFGKHGIRQMSLAQQLQHANERLMERVDDLESQLKQKDDDLRQERATAEQAKERSDTIVLQLTRQLENQQKLLEYHQEPWYRRWFKKTREENLS